MNRGKSYILFAIFVLVGSLVSLSAQSKKEKKKQEKEAVVRLVESKNYKIDVKSAMPMSGRTVPLSPYFSLEIKNDSVVSCLPYYGRAYSIPYNGGDGLNFSAPIQQYSMEKNKKGSMDVRFVTRNAEDRYEFSLHLYTNGSAYIHVNMQNRQSISFHGDLIKEEGKKKTK